jgi:hypothetical protein
MLALLHCPQVRCRTPMDALPRFDERAQTGNKPFHLIERQHLLHGFFKGRNNVPVLRCSRGAFLEAMRSLLHSRALLPLIPPTPFSHEGRRGSLGVLKPKTR